MRKLMTADETKTLYMFDIETEGLAGVDHRVNTAGFKEYGPTGKHTIYYIKEDGVEEVSPSDIEASSTVDLRPVDSEKELFREVYKFIDENEINNPNMASIVGFNSSDYDITTLRTRRKYYSFEDIPNWILTDVEHLDIYNVVKYNENSNTEDPANVIDNLNKSQLVDLEEWIFGVKSGKNKSPLQERLKEEEDQFDEEAMEFILEEFADVKPEDFISEVNDLEGFYEAVTSNPIYEDDQDYVVVEDPFDDSEEVPPAFENGNLTDVIQHNVADLERTEWLASDVIEEAGSKSELAMNDGVNQETL